MDYKAMIVSTKEKEDGRNFSKLIFLLHAC